MADYSYPSIFFANFLFLLLVAGAVFFFVRSFKDGYWGRHSEEPKYRMLNDDTAGQRGSADKREIHHG